MKTAILIIWFLNCALLGMWIGLAIPKSDPTPHECISICVEYYEKMGLDKFDCDIK